VRIEETTVAYELWDFETGSAIGEYAHKADALAVVRDNVRAYGPSAVDGVALLAVDRKGESRLVAQGEALLKLLSEHAAT